MSRTFAFVAVFAAGLAACVSCSKAGDEPSAPVNAPATGAAPTTSASNTGTGARQVTPMTPAGSGAIDPQLRLHAEEGTLAITPPADSKAGAEAVATITLTPTAAYHVNTDFPIKLVLDPPANVTLEKAELKAGGSIQKGDAQALDERQLVFAIKLTPSQSGNYTINGSFKFAVCTDKQCLPKKEPIAIQIAAK